MSFCLVQIIFFFVNHRFRRLCPQSPSNHRAVLQRRQSLPTRRWRISWFDFSKSKVSPLLAHRHGSMAHSPGHRRQHIIHVQSRLDSSANPWLFFVRVQSHLDSQSHPGLFSHIRLLFSVSWPILLGHLYFQHPWLFTPPLLGHPASNTASSSWSLSVVYC